MILAILFWVVLLLASVGAFIPNSPWPQVSNAAALVLFVLVGLRIFRLDI